MCRYRSSERTAPALEVALATWVGAAAGQINLYCWKHTAANDCTLIAATVAVDVSGWPSASELSGPPRPAPHLLEVKCERIPTFRP